MVKSKYEKSDTAPGMISLVPRKLPGTVTSHQRKGGETGHLGHGH